jgi:hypothetical protein
VAVHFNAVYICAEGGKEDLVLHPVSNLVNGIVLENFYGGMLYVQTARCKSFKGRISKSIEGC